MKIKFTVNGKKQEIDKHPHVRLIDYLREDLKLTGTKEGCGEGECGACAVFLDGRVVNSCIVVLAQLEGRKVETIEHFAKTKKGKAITEAFMEEGAVQCGYCTPGMVLSSEAVLSSTNGKPKEADIREGLSGNLCRCTGYDHIVNAVLKAAKKNKELWQSEGK